MTTTHDTFLIGGEWQTAKSSDIITVTSPNTEVELGRVPGAGRDDIDAAVAAARQAFDDKQGWSNWTASARADVLDTFASALESRQEVMAQTVSSQNGMPIGFCRMADSVFGAVLLRYYAEQIRSGTTEDLRVGSTGNETVVRHEPIGVVAAIVPWNFPQSITFMKLAPLLAAGCTVVLKPAPQTVLDAYLLAEASLEAGLPPGVVNVVPGDREAGAYLVSHPGVDKVAFTGSTAAGRVIAAECGRLLRPVTLELGGKSAAIVLDDTDLVNHLPMLFAATLANNGQTCHLSTRILASRKRYTEVVDTLSDFVRSLSVGDSLDEKTMVGPMVSRAQLDRVEGYIAKGRAEGARVTVGGGRPSGLDRGFFVEPTVFADLDNSHTIAREEIFGPVLVVLPYDDVDDAIRIANDSEYGLAGTVWTDDVEAGLSVARQVTTGTYGVNGYSGDLVAPFGGVKSSGIGRENGPEGLRAFQYSKSIFLPMKGF